MRGRVLFHLQMRQLVGCRRLWRRRRIFLRLCTVRCRCLWIRVGVRTIHLLRLFLILGQDLRLCRYKIGCYCLSGTHVIDVPDDFEPEVPSKHRGKRVVSRNLLLQRYRSLFFSPF
jgi:hypothetical protein